MKMFIRFIAFMVFRMEFVGCDVNKETNPPEFLNITGSWYYDAVFKKGDSTLHILTTVDTLPSLDITSGDGKFAGRFHNASLQRCKNFNCGPSIPLQGNVYDGIID